MRKSRNMGVSPLGATSVFPLLSFHLGSDRNIYFHPVIGFIYPLKLPAFTRLPAMVNPGTPRSPRLVVEALRTKAIPTEIAAILVYHYRTIREDGANLMEEKRSGWGIHSFLTHLLSGVDLVSSP